MATTKAVRLCSRIPLIMLCAFSMRAQQMAVPTDAATVNGEVPTAQSANLPVEKPLSAPRVSCLGSQLTIDAENSTLGSVLSAVHDCIGVEIIMPDGAADQRSYVRLGPGPVRDVLDELLSSTQYSYAIQSSKSSPEKIASILLMEDVKDSGAVQNNIGAPPFATGGALTPARRAWLESVRTARAAGTRPNAVESNTFSSEPVTPSIPETSPSAQTNPNAVPGTGDSSQPSSAADNSAADASPATPDLAALPGSTRIPASSEPAQQIQPASGLQNQIDQMQQLFEQRKKLAAGQGQPPG